MNYTQHRLPWGAEVFKAEVADRYPDAEFENDERDGIGIYRSLVVTTEHAKELGHLLVPIFESSDVRIAGWEANTGSITVFFTGTDEAENSEPFYLARVADTLLPAEPVKKPAKKAAKKAAPKT